MASGTVVKNEQEQMARVVGSTSLAEPRATAPAVLPITTPLGDRITTDRTLRDDLWRSLVARGHDAGRTFGSFITACRAAGVRDETPLDSIEYGIKQAGSGRILVDFEDDAASIGEV